MTKVPHSSKPHGAAPALSPIRMSMFDTATILSNDFLYEFEKHAVKGVEKTASLEKGILGHGRRRRASYQVEAAPNYLTFRGRTVNTFNKSFIPRSAEIVAHYEPNGMAPGKFTWLDSGDDVIACRQKLQLHEFQQDSIMVRQKDAYRIMIVMCGILKADGMYFHRSSNTKVDVYIIRDDRLPQVKLYQPDSVLQFTDRSYRQLITKFAVNERHVMLEYFDQISGLQKELLRDRDGDVTGLIGTAFSGVDPLSDDEDDEVESDPEHYGSSASGNWSSEIEAAEAISDDDSNILKTVIPRPPSLSRSIPEIQKDLSMVPETSLQDEIVSATTLIPSHNSNVAPVKKEVLVPSLEDLQSNALRPSPASPSSTGLPADADIPEEAGATLINPSNRSPNKPGSTGKDRTQEPKKSDDYRSPNEPGSTDNDRIQEPEESDDNPEEAGFLKAVKNMWPFAKKKVDPPNRLDQRVSPNQEIPRPDHIDSKLSPNPVKADKRAQQALPPTTAPRPADTLPKHHPADDDLDGFNPEQDNAPSRDASNGWPAPKDDVPPKGSDPTAKDTSRDDRPKQQPHNRKSSPVHENARPSGAPASKGSPSLASPDDAWSNLTDNTPPNAGWDPRPNLHSSNDTARHDLQQDTAKPLDADHDWSTPSEDIPPNDDSWPKHRDGSPSNSGSDLRSRSQPKNNLLGHRDPESGKIPRDGVSSRANALPRTDKENDDGDDASPKPKGQSAPHAVRNPRPLSQPRDGAGDDQVSHALPRDDTGSGQNGPSPTDNQHDDGDDCWPTLNGRLPPNAGWDPRPLSQSNTVSREHRDPEDGKAPRGDVKSGENALPRSQKRRDNADDAPPTPGGQKSAPNAARNPRPLSQPKDDVADDRVSHAPRDNTGSGQNGPLPTDNEDGDGDDSWPTLNGKAPPNAGWNPQPLSQPKNDSRGHRGPENEDIPRDGVESQENALPRTDKNRDDGDGARPTLKGQSPPIADRNPRPFSRPINDAGDNRPRDDGGSGQNGPLPTGNEDDHSDDSWPTVNSQTAPNSGRDPRRLSQPKSVPREHRDYKDGKAPRDSVESQQNALPRSDKGRDNSDGSWPTLKGKSPPNAGWDPRPLSEPKFDAGDDRVSRIVPQDNAGSGHNGPLPTDNEDMDADEPRPALNGQSAPNAGRDSRPLSQPKDGSRGHHDRESEGVPRDSVANRANALPRGDKSRDDAEDARPTLNDQSAPNADRYPRPVSQPKNVSRENRAPKSDQIPRGGIAPRRNALPRTEKNRPDADDSWSTPNGQKPASNAGPNPRPLSQQKDDVADNRVSRAEALPRENTGSGQDSPLPTDNEDDDGGDSWPTIKGKAPPNAGWNPRPLSKLKDDAGDDRVSRAEALPRDNTRFGQQPKNDSLERRDPESDEVPRDSVEPRENTLPHTDERRDDADDAWPTLNGQSPPNAGWNPRPFSQLKGDAGKDRVSHALPRDNIESGQNGSLPTDNQHDDGDDSWPTLKSKAPPNAGWNPRLTSDPNHRDPAHVPESAHRPDDSSLSEDDRDSAKSVPETKSANARPAQVGSDIGSSPSSGLRPHESGLHEASPSGRRDGDYNPHIQGDQPRSIPDPKRGVAGQHTDQDDSAPDSGAPVTEHHPTPVNRDYQEPNHPRSPDHTDNDHHDSVPTERANVVSQRGQEPEKGDHRPQSGVVKHPSSDKDSRSQPVDTSESSPGSIWPNLAAIAAKLPNLGGKRPHKPERRPESPNQPQENFQDPSVSRHHQEDNVASVHTTSRTNPDRAAGYEAVADDNKPSGSRPSSRASNPDRSGYNTGRNPIPSSTHLPSSTPTDHPRRHPEPHRIDATPDRVTDRDEIDHPEQRLPHSSPDRSSKYGKGEDDAETGITPSGDGVERSAPKPSDQTEPRRRIPSQISRRDDVKGSTYECGGTDDVDVPRERSSHILKNWWPFTQRKPLAADNRNDDERHAPSNRSDDNTSSRPSDSTRKLAGPAPGLSKGDNPERDPQGDAGSGSLPNQHHDTPDDVTHSDRVSPHLAPSHDRNRDRAAPKKLPTNTPNDSSDDKHQVTPDSDQRRPNNNPHDATPSSPVDEQKDNHEYNRPRPSGADHYETPHYVEDDEMDDDVPKKSKWPSIGSLLGFASVPDAVLSKNKKNDAEENITKSEDGALLPDGTLRKRPRTHNNLSSLLLDALEKTERAPEFTLLDDSENTPDDTNEVDELPETSQLEKLALCCTWLCGNPMPTSKN